MKISQKGIDLIKKFEPIMLYPFKKNGSEMIGYGHIIQSGKNYRKFNQEKADYILFHELQDISDLINDSIKIGISQNQFDALCSLLHRNAIANFTTCSGLVNINKNKFKLAGELLFFHSSERCRIEKELWEN